jgi:heat-inducible transcriptional repressor
LKGSVQLLSRLTQYAGLAVPPSVAEEPIVRLELIDMGPTMMVLAVGQHGRVDKRMLDRPDSLDDRALRETEKRLGELRGLTYNEAQARLLQLAAEDAREHRDLLLDVAETLRTAQQGESGGHVVVGGASNLADEAQAWRRETLRRLFETLEREQEIMHVLQDVSAGSAGLAVTIGTEHPSTGEWDASLVTAPFKVGDATLGTIGVVGPTRMDYLSAMASVRAVARRLSELATELDG